jgi:predicted nucleotidyltransferase
MRREYNLSKMKRRRSPYGKRLAGLPEQIQSLAGRIAEEISPQRIILFGSHAQGTFGPDSDVDLLVITDRPAGSDASLRLRRKVEYSFPLDLVVCDARRLQQRIEAGDFFLQDAVQFGKVLYERHDGGVAGKS